MIDSMKLLSCRVGKPEKFGGVYFLFKGDEIVYVGRSTNVLHRIYDHQKNKDFDTWCFIPIHELESGPIEEMCIHKYRPKYNKQYFSTSLPYETIEKIECGFIRLDPLGVENVITLPTS